MSREARDWAWDQARSRTITEPVDLLILQNLADVAGENGENAHPSRRRLSEECLASERTITRRLAALVERGLIELTAPATRTRPAVYKLIGVTEHAQAVRNISSGRLGGQSVSPNPQTPEWGANGVPMGCQSGDTVLRETSDEVEEELEKQTTPSLTIDDHDHPVYGWDRFWERYPKRDGKKGSKKLAVGLWRSMTYEHKAEAWRQLGEYVRICAAGRPPMDAQRWLRQGIDNGWNPDEGWTFDGTAPAGQQERGTVTARQVLLRRPPEDLTYEEFLESLVGCTDAEHTERREGRRMGLAWKVRTETGDLPTPEAGWLYFDREGWVQRG